MLRASTRVNRTLDTTKPGTTPGLEGCWYRLPLVLGRIYQVVCLPRLLRRRKSFSARYSDFVASAGIDVLPRHRRRGPRGKAFCRVHDKVSLFRIANKRDSDRGRPALGPLTRPGSERYDVPALAISDDRPRSFPTSGQLKLSGGLLPNLIALPRTQTVGRTRLGRIVRRTFLQVNTFAKFFSCFYANKYPHEFADPRDREKKFHASASFIHEFPTFSHMLSPWK